MGKVRLREFEAAVFAAECPAGRGSADGAHDQVGVLTVVGADEDPIPWHRPDLRYLPLHDEHTRHIQRHSPIVGGFDLGKARQSDSGVRGGT